MTRHMKTALFTLGTMGDIQMYLPLAKTIQAAGHELTFCTYSLYEEKVRTQGLEFQAIPPHIEADFFNQVYDAVKDKNFNDKAETAIDNLFTFEIWARFEACLEIVKDCDLVICHQIDWAAQVAAEVCEIPWVEGLPSPLGMPNEGFIPFGLRTCSLGAPLNKLSWHLIAVVMRHTMHKEVQAFGKKAGSQRKDLGFFSMSPHLNLLATSVNLAMLPGSLPANTIATGAWTLSEPNYCLDERVLQFLAAGPPPAVVGFGSMGGNQEDGRKTAQLIIDALRSQGQRIIMQKGWGHLDSTDDSDILSIDYIPHEHLFPHAAFVIHHGGAGTTTAAAMAGVPQIIVAHGVDQFYWGETVFKRGIGAKLLDRKKLTQKALAKRIQFVLADYDALRRRAQTLAVKLAGEDGTAVALAALERFHRQHQTALSFYPGEALAESL